MTPTESTDIGVLEKAVDNLIECREKLINMPYQRRYTDDGKELIQVYITRREFLQLPMETRRRVLAEQAEILAKES